MSKENILKEFELFSLGTGGIGNWITKNTDSVIFERLSDIEKIPLKKVQLNQLLVLGHEAPISDDFFKYYWLQIPKQHPYLVEKIPGYTDDFLKKQAIVSIDHLKWGLYRLFVDSLLYFGNVRSGYRQLRSLNEKELNEFFNSKRFETEVIRERGPALPLSEIPKDDRYLISEMACKSYGDDPKSPSDLKNILIEAFREHKRKGGGRITIKELLEGDTVTKKHETRQGEFLFSADDVLDEIVGSEEELEEKYERISKQFFSARTAAIANTKKYLSMVSDLDVYVATSMRNRKDFRAMANKTDKIFSDKRLQELEIRYFDPTMSAASGHEDKGLIECLMVKCAKLLVYCAGEKESYGKDAEAAMALSLGKPVIFLCDHEQKSRFYKDVHPLVRLIHFETGIAVGSIVTESLTDVSELIYRVFENKMEYELDQLKPGYLRLKEKLTGSVVRLQTNDTLLAETFWNHYHG